MEDYIEYFSSHQGRDTITINGSIYRIEFHSYPPFKLEFIESFYMECCNDEDRVYRIHADKYRVLEYIYLLGTKVEEKDYSVQFNKDTAFTRSIGFKAFGYL